MELIPFFRGAYKSQQFMLSDRATFLSRSVLSYTNLSPSGMHHPIMSAFFFGSNVFVVLFLVVLIFWDGRRSCLYGKFSPHSPLFEHLPLSPDYKTLPDRSIRPASSPNPRPFPLRLILSLFHTLEPSPHSWFQLGGRAAPFYARFPLYGQFPKSGPSFLTEVQEQISARSIEFCFFSLLGNSIFFFFLEVLVRFSIPAKPRPFLRLQFLPSRFVPFPSLFIFSSLLVSSYQVRPGLSTPISLVFFPPEPV